MPKTEMLKLTNKQQRSVLTYRIVGFIFDCLTVGVFTENLNYRFYGREDIILLQQLREIPASEYKINYTKIISTPHKSLTYGDYFVVLDEHYNSVSLYKKNSNYNPLTLRYYSCSLERKHHKKTFEHLKYIWERHNEQKLKNTTWIS